ncbi:MAG: exonuclease SbcCD subunit D [Eubacterium sp.]|nr:exonuclease SbcCD subunit D [Eubacterium sp.]
MKLIHISDLHIGKRLYGYDLEDDQRHILSEIIELIKSEKPDAVLIAGDIYDRADPSATAVRIFDDFLSMLADTGVESFIIYGNHDSGQRIAYGSRLFGRSGIHFSPVYDGEVARHSLEDEYGRVNIYMLPYLRSADAAEAIRSIKADRSERNIIVSHQFVTSAVLGESEEMNVGTLDNIDGACYDAFDYAALGHIHMPQTISPAPGSGTVIRYSGSPLAYSFSESDTIQKSVTVIDLKEKGFISVDTISLMPLHELRTIKGSFDDLINDKGLIESCKNDYIKIILTDDTGIMDAMARLQKAYGCVMMLEYEYMREQSEDVSVDEIRAEGTPEEMFVALYGDQHGGKEMNEYQKNVVDKLIKQIWEGQEAQDETD